MKPPILFCLLLPLLLLHCTTPQTQTDNSSAQVQTPFYPESLEGISLGETLLKEIEEGADEMMLADCGRWMPPAAKLTDALEAMKKVSSEAQYGLCYHLPCSMKGKATLKGNPFEISIWAGGYATLSTPDTSYYFLIETESEAFLASCDCCAEEGMD